MRREVVVAATRNGDTVEVAVSDSGAGIAADVANKLFTPFVTTKARGPRARPGDQPHHRREPRRPAVGDGPAQDAGATFRFSLPLAEIAGDGPARLDHV